MSDRPALAPLSLLWLAWLVYWFAAARDVKATARREPGASRLGHSLLMIVAGVLLSLRHLPGGLSAHFFQPSAATYALGLIMVAGGLGISIWARRVLGRNWSGIVTVKQDHELIRTGPYRYVRHPIYTGLLLAILGTALIFGEWRGLIAFVIFTAAIMLKVRAEERFMDESFPEQYARYRAEVPALLPFLPQRAEQSTS